MGDLAKITAAGTAFAGLLSGTAAAALTHGLTLAEGKGGWLGTVHTFPSTMAQNFWIAIFAWTTCFVVTIAVSFLSQPRPEKELEGLVYGLTKIKHEEDYVAMNWHYARNLTDPIGSWNDVPNGGTLLDGNAHGPYFGIIEIPNCAQ